MPWTREDGRYFSEKQKRAMWKLHSEEGKSITEVAEQVGCSTSGASYIIGNFRKRQAAFKENILDPMKQHKESKQVPANGKVQVLKATLSLQEENEFLRWWNQGERKGWVDRLLSEIQK